MAKGSMANGSTANDERSPGSARRGTSPWRARAAFWRFRAALLSASAVLVATVTASCGGDDGKGGTLDGGAPPAPVSDAQAASDAFVPDTGGDAQDAAPVCAPAAWAPPRKASKCTSAEIADMLDVCLAQGMASARCVDFRAQHADCAGCLYQNVAAADVGRGPWLGLGQTASKLIDVNVAGCIALIEGVPGDTGCGAKAWAASVCSYQACCAEVSLEAFQTCAGKASAAGGACSAQTAERDGCIAVIHGAEACFVGGGPAKEQFQRVGELFCGGRVDGDGGSDGGADASDANAPETGSTDGGSRDAGPG